MQLRLGSLFFKYLAVLIAVAGGIALLQGAIESWLASRQAVQFVSELQLSEAKRASLLIEQWLANIERQIHAVGSLPLQNTAESLKLRRQEYLRLMTLFPAIESMRLLDASGQEMLAVSQLQLDVLNSGNDHGHDVEFIETRANGRYLGAVEFRDGSEPFANLALCDNKACRSITVGHLNLKFVSEVVRGIHFGMSGISYVVDNHKQLIAHPNTSLVLKKLDIASYVQILALTKAASVAPAAAMETLDFSGNSVLSTAVPVPNTGYWVFTEQSRSEALQPMYATVWRTVIIALVGVLGAVLLAYWFARIFSKPIHVLRNGAASIGSGDYATRIDVKTGDELESLATEFNKMADQLQDYTTGLERKVAEKTIELETANRHKSEFLANMSHELRTPLTAVIGFSDVLRAKYFGPLNDKQQQYIEDIKASGEHLLSLINDILDLSKIEAGRMDLELTSFHLPTAIDNAMTLVRERAMRHQLQLKASIAPEIAMVVADERKVKQILINLLSNAVKFSYPNGWVEVVVTRGTNETVITVKDSGVGIAAEDQQTIFEAFRQLSTQLGAKQESGNEGTGLGLSLVKSLTVLHGGYVEVVSELGKGAAFRFTLPDRVVL
jgi:signal transduction histidine kinase